MNWLHIYSYIRSYIYVAIAMAIISFLNIQCSVYINAKLYRIANNVAIFVYLNLALHSAQFHCSSPGSLVTLTQSLSKYIINA